MMRKRRAFRQDVVPWDFPKPFALPDLRCYWLRVFTDCVLPRRGLALLLIARCRAWSLSPGGYFYIRKNQNWWPHLN
jgi:hypothetical protein